MRVIIVGNILLTNNFEIENEQDTMAEITMRFNLLAMRQKNMQYWNLHVKSVRERNFDYLRRNFGVWRQKSIVITTIKFRRFFFLLHRTLKSHNSHLLYYSMLFDEQKKKNHIIMWYVKYSVELKSTKTSYHKSGTKKTERNSSWKRREKKQRQTWISIGVLPVTRFFLALVFSLFFFSCVWILISF